MSVRATGKPPELVNLLGKLVPFKDGMPVMVENEGVFYVVLFTDLLRLQLAMRWIGGWQPGDPVKWVDDAGVFNETIPPEVGMMLNPYRTEQGNTRFTLVVRAAMNTQRSAEKEVLEQVAQSVEPGECRLTRTKQALEKYDAVRARFDELVGDGTGEIDDVLEQLLRAEDAVGEAFAADTADRNDPATARMIVPCTWLRRMVAKYG